MFRKKPVVIGAEMPVSVLYKNHHIIKGHFNDIIISIEDMDIEATTKVFKNFGAYNLYVKPPSYLNVFDAKNNSESFAKTMQFYKGLLNISSLNLNGVIIDLGQYGSLSPEYVDNIFKNIFLKKLILEYTRRGKTIILRNTATSFTKSFSISYILSVTRLFKNKHLVAGLDTEKSHYLNAGFLKKETSVAELGRLRKEFGFVFLSGIGKKGKRSSIFECSVYPEHSYVNLVKGLNKSRFFLEYDGNLRELIEDKERLKMLVG